MGDALTIGEVASRSGVAASALRFYEQRSPRNGPIPGTAGTAHGSSSSPSSCSHRRLACRWRKSAGSSRLPRNRAPERADWAKLSRSWTKRIEADRGIGTNEDDAHRVYRLRMPFTRPLPVCEPRRSRGATQRRSALLDSIDGPLIPRGSHLLCSAIMPSSADVVIIGGGVVGSAVAYHLREAGCRGRIVVIERDDSYSRASSIWQWAAFDNSSRSKPASGWSNTSVGFYQDLDRRVPVAGVNFRQRGYLLSPTPTAPRDSRRCEAMRSAGAHVAWLSRDEIRRRLPDASLDDIEFGVFGPEDGYANPKAVLFAMKTIAEDAGAEYVRAEVHARADEQQSDGGRVRR